VAALSSNRAPADCPVSRMWWCAVRCICWSRAVCNPSCQERMSGLCEWPQQWVRSLATAEPRH